MIRKIKRLAWFVLLLGTIALLAIDGGGNPWAIIAWAGTVAAVAIVGGGALALGIIGIVVKHLIRDRNSGGD